MQIEDDSGVKSAKASLQDLTASSKDQSPEPYSKSRDKFSLALNAGQVSTPRSTSPLNECDGMPYGLFDQGSFIYSFLEEAIKKDKRKKAKGTRHDHSTAKEAVNKNSNHVVSQMHKRRRCEHHRSGKEHDSEHNRSHNHGRSSERVRSPKRVRSSVDTRSSERVHGRSPDRIQGWERKRSPDDMERNHGHKDSDREADFERARDISAEADSTPREHRRRRHEHHRRRREEPSRDDTTNDKPVKEKSQLSSIDQTVLLETFAKLCSNITQNSKTSPPEVIEVTRNQSHKSLQCEVVSTKDASDVEQRPVRLRREGSHDATSSCTHVRSLEEIRGSRSRCRSPTRCPNDDYKEKYYSHVENKQLPKYSSKMDVVPGRSKAVLTDRCREYLMAVPTRSCMDHAYRRELERHECERSSRDRRAYDEERRRSYEEERRRCCEKTSRSFDVHREPYPEDEIVHRSTRSDSRRKRYEDPRPRYEDRDRRYDDCYDKYYEDRQCNPASKERWRRNLELFERSSLASREEEARRVGCSERERDSGLSVADDASTVSGKSNYINVVKQGIYEQRDAMEKMMKLWKELMRCFKGIAQGPEHDKAAQLSAANVQESAAAQLRLWRECMRRYETVARDVGDTDQRLMDEIAKQRSEMAEMANMWQECLQRYRDISNDFKQLKQQLVSETACGMTTRPAPAGSQPTDDKPPPPAPPYRMPPVPYLPPHAHAQAVEMGSYDMCAPSAPGGLRARASLPTGPPVPPWWVYEQQPSRRRSSPDSRRSRSRSRSRDREHKHRHKDRAKDDTRYKEKPTAKLAAARMDHRRRKR